MTGPRRLHSRSDLLAASGDDAFLAHELPDPLPGPAFANGDAVAATRVTRLRGARLFLLGPPDEVARLLRHATARLWGPGGSPGLRGVSVPPEALEAAASAVPLGPGGDWEWMVTTTPPPAPDPPPRGEVASLPLPAVPTVPLGPEDEAEVRALLEDGNTRTDARPWRSPGQAWVGVRAGDGTLLACGCREPGPTASAQVLTGITVARAARRRGHGRAVTARLATDAVAAAGAATLGVYADNPAAGGLYRRLGFGDVHPWASRSLR